MDTKKIIALVVGVLLTVAGSIFGYNFKGEVCGEVAPAAQVEAK